MGITELLADPRWDTPFFKRLAHNDTSSAPGHQAGMVFPKDLRTYLPVLDEARTSTVAPTTDRYLRAEMFVGEALIGEGELRYQLQTWGGKRRAESRITDGFAPIHTRAFGGDLLLFQRSTEALDRYRLILVKQGDPEFRAINHLTGARNWGPLYATDAPVNQQQLSQANNEILSITEQPFQLIGPVRRVDTRQRRIARCSVFRERVRRAYNHTCAVSSIDIATPRMIYEVESSHVVPVSEGGSDDLRNGLALTQTLHWAFDKGLFGIRPNRTIYIPRRVRAMQENSFLRQYENQPITEARSQGLRVHADAFRWHFENRVIPWE